MHDHFEEQLVEHPHTTDRRKHEEGGKIGAAPLAVPRSV